MSTPLPRYRGWSGACRYAALLFLIVAAIGAVSGGFVWAITHDTPAGWWLFSRLALFAAVTAIAAGLCRGLAGASWDRFLTLRWARGDGGIFGAVAGLVVAGLLTANTTFHLLRTPPEGLRVGARFELAGKTVDGEPFNIADYRGHPVVVDFWATWCGPCIKELPNLRGLYEKYEAQGLRMVGISHDEDRTALFSFLKTNPIPWPTLFFDQPGQTGFKNPIAKKHGIESIPLILVVDREGIIAASDVRGPELTRAVAAMFGEQAGTPWYRQGFQALLRGVLAAEWWLLAACVIGGALAACVIELAIRRLFGKRAA